MTPQECRATLSLASIYAFRMLGLFMIIPILSLYTLRLAHADVFLIGLALGIYGLTQALLQIPLGMLSDRIGRKPVIIVGLLIFILGSAIAALSHGIYGVILGRALQGAGAIGSTLIALLADTTMEENRLKAMSVIGMTIGFSFMGAMVLGPLFNDWVGLSGVFWIAAGLGLMSLLLLRVVPTLAIHPLHQDCEPVISQFKTVLKMPELLRLNCGIFILHAMLMALFIVIPMALVGDLGFREDEQWMVYLPVLLAAAVFMVPFVILAEVKKVMKPVFVGAIFAIVVAEVLLWQFHQTILSLSLILCLFFTAFTLLEAILPSLVSKIAPKQSKGTAMGIYSTSQFLGVFFGGSLGGVLFNAYGQSGVLLFCAAMGFVWLVVASSMKKPPVKQKSETLPRNKIT